MLFRRRRTDSVAEAPEPAAPSSAASDSAVAGALDDAAALAAEGNVPAAIDSLSTANRELRSAEIERRLVELRREALAVVEREPSSPVEPSALPEEAVENGVPELPSDRVSPGVLRAAILERGCLLVRGLIPQERAQPLVDGIDRAFDGFDAHVAGTPASSTTPWYEPFGDGTDPDLVLAQKFVRAGDGVWGVESPRTLFEYLDAAEETGMKSLVSSYLGERPAISVKKCTLRRTPPETGRAAGPSATWWHQDGAFLGGRDIRSLNVWLSLSHCGRDAPGLDIVPQRFNHILETGTDGALYSWSISPDTVDRATKNLTVSRPLFEPGDALLFDHLFLHRTGISPEMTRTRYAIETWFFSPTAHPDQETLLLV